MIYLNNAATSLFKPKEATSALTSPSLPIGRWAGDSAILARQLRSKLLSLTNATDHTAVLLSGCTHALNQAVTGLALSLKSPCRILVTSAEHNAVLRPVYALEALGFPHTVVRTDEKGVISPKSLEAAVTPDVKIAVISHTSNVTGGTNDLNELSAVLKKHGIIFIVDCAQSIGTIDVDLSNVDLAAFPFHKGLHSFPGLGGLIIRNGLSLIPIISGGTGTLSAEKHMPDFSPERYEAGTYNTPCISAGLAALEWEERYRKEIRENLSYIGGFIRQRLSELPEIKLLSPDNPFGIVTFALNDENFDSAELAQRLSEQDIIVRGGLHCAPLMHERLGTDKCGAVRVSAGIDTTEREALTFISTLKQLFE